MNFFRNNRNIKEVSTMGTDNKDLEKKEAVENANAKNVDEKALEQVAGGRNSIGSLSKAVEAGYYVDYTGKMH